MSLGTGALKVGRGREHFRPRQGGIHGNPVSGNHPEYTDSEVLGERGYPHNRGGAMVQQWREAGLAWHCKFSRTKEAKVAVQAAQILQ